MKKVILLFVVVVSFALTSNNVLAQTKSTTGKAVVKTEQKATTPCSFVDKDKNGICDKHEAKVKDGKTCTAKCDGKGQGKCCPKEKAGTKGCGEQKGTGCGSSCKHGQTVKGNTVPVK